MALSLAVVSLAAGPLGAQNSSVAGPPAPKPSDIGPAELSNFSLNGTVTQPADKPAAVKPAPITTAPATVNVGPTRDAPTTTTAAPSAAPAARTAPPDSDLFRRPPTLPGASGATPIDAAPPPLGNVLPPPATAPSSDFSLWPWIIGLLAIAGGALLWFGRQRRQGQRPATAGNAPIDIVRAPEPALRSNAPAGFVPRPDPIPAAAPLPTGARKPLPTTLMPPAPQSATVRPRADPIIPGAIVSTGLRPWIDVELSPDRALIDEKGAAIAFEVTLYNSGSAAARDVVIEAKLLNAGASQDVELSAFFTAEATLSDPIPQIAPYARVPLRSAVRLPREAISEYDYEGRKLFMPLVAISVRYRWASGEGQSAAGFLVGQGSEGQEKLAPLRIDRGARSWAGLGARRYEKGVRR
ncbi:MAG: hypothetical protein ABIR87_01110 [Sphingomicrobium sp.]